LERLTEGDVMPGSDRHLPPIADRIGPIVEERRA
jgi:hypothetical protein